MPFKYQGNDIKKTLIILPHIALELFFLSNGCAPLIIKTVSMLQGSPYNSIPGLLPVVTAQALRL